MLWALGPKSGLSSEPQFISFEKSLSKALHTGFFNEVFKTEEPLEFVEATLVGDSHVYFSIEKVDIGNEFARVEASV